MPVTTRVGPDIEVVLIIAVVLCVAGFVIGYKLGRSKSGRTDGELQTTRERSSIGTVGSSADAADAGVAGPTTTDSTTQADPSPPAASDDDVGLGQADAGYAPGYIDRTPDTGHQISTTDEEPKSSPDSPAETPDATEPIKADVETLRDALRTETPEERVAAARRLADIGGEHPELVEPAEEDLKRLRLDSNDEVSKAAAQALERITSSRE